MSRYKKIILSTVITLIIASSAATYLSWYLPSTMTLHGVATSMSDGWGIHTDMIWYRPLMNRNILIAGLPEKFQQVGSRLTLNGRIVTRSRVDWGTSIVPTSVNGERLVQNKFGETVPESLATSNISQAQLHDQQVAEEQAKKIWDPVLADAKTTIPFSFGGLTFQVPQNMKKENIKGTIIFSFPVDLPEGPVIVFSTTAQSIDEIMATAKKSFSPYESYIQDRTETDNGVNWRIVEHTTEIGINSFLWYHQGNPNVAVQFTEALDDIEEVFQQILQTVNTQ